MVLKHDSMGAIWTISFLTIWKLLQPLPLWGKYIIVIYYLGGDRRLPESGKGASCKRIYYREIRTKGNAAADRTVTDRRTGGGAETAGCKVARWNVAAAPAGGCCLLPRSMTAGVPPSKDRLRGLLTAGTAADGSCCWLNIHRKYQDIAQAYCAGSAGTTHDLHLAGRTTNTTIVPISMGTRTYGTRKTRAQSQNVTE